VRQGIAHRWPSARGVPHDIGGSSPTRARRTCLTNGDRVDELVAIQSRSILVDAFDRIVCSPANYWAATVGDLTATLAFLVLGLRRFTGAWIMAAAVVIAGFLSVGLLEYVVHRWILHGPFSLATRGHAQHHAAPSALISTPVFVATIGALAVWGLLRIVLPARIAALTVFGLYAGYDYFALVHYRQHHRRHGLAGVAYWRRLERLHHLHHHRPMVNFGISTTVWDRLFGTFQATTEPVMNPSSRARSDWAG
jgi:4-hydroxysphinganine ceramide fatty acyl 2-hydroxylase